MTVKSSPAVKLRTLLITGIGIVALLAGAGYWYVFIAGAPQLDAPPTEAKDSKIKLFFELKTFNSKAMGEVRQYGVILPPGYEKNPNKHYPVIFLLHGGHDDANAWVKKIGIIPVLEDLYESGKLLPSIVITPDGNDKRGSSPLFDPQYYDGPNGNVGTLIGSELVQMLKSRYRTLESPQFWAIGGLSSGGWGAVNIGLHHRNTFHTMFSQIGYFTDQSGPENSPQSLIKKIPVKERKLLHIYMDAGKDDLMGKEFLDSSQKFHETLNELGIDNEFHAFPGGHGLQGPDYGWNYDHKHAHDSLSFVGRQFKKALTQPKN
ncbi:alpha/beta hydrolase [Allocoleopsis franciscana]|uniref:Enterochelin esterase-like enzyme n=1 Tax=Allocoleopsis franciscana PCC 7113 TaxID=1173027 RepID=K9W7B1_9CYAN|nr:enterochelin esterase-like enzyme [Allocoleopsis franciscana PCC 7113]